MQEVVILSGAYGARSETGRVCPVFRGERISVSETEARRLLKMGAARLVAGVPAVPPAAPRNGPDPDRMPTDTPEGKAPAGTETGGEDGPSDDLDAAALERMTKADLERMAEDMGVDISGAKTKREMAELIAEAGGDDGELPELEGGDIVR